MTWNTRNTIIIINIQMCVCNYVLLTAARAIPSYTRPNGAAVRECIEYGIAQSRSQ